MNVKDGRKKKTPKILIRRRHLGQENGKVSTVRKLQDQFGNLQEELRQWVAEAVSVNHLKHH